MNKILLVIGSLRDESLNLQLADAIMTKLAGRAEVAELEYDDIPWLNEDIEFPTPPGVARVRYEVLNADGIWFVSPEYNGSYPAHVKNLIDWLSRNADDEHRNVVAIEEKPVTVSGAGGRGATRKMQEKLIELLDVVGAKVMAGPAVAISLPAQAFSTSELELTAEDEAAIDEQVEEFLAFVDEEA